MSKKAGSEFLGKAVERIFQSHEDIAYIAAVNSKLKIIEQKGFIELHPSKLHILHVQAALLVGMSSVWSETLGKLDYTCASFNSKSEIMVIPVDENIHILAVLSPVNKRSLDSIKEQIVQQFKSMQAT